MDIYYLFSQSAFVYYYGTALVFIHVTYVLKNIVNTFYLFFVTYCVDFCFIGLDL